MVTQNSQNIVNGNKLSLKKVKRDIFQTVACFLTFTFTG